MGRLQRQKGFQIVNAFNEAHPFYDHHQVDGIEISLAYPELKIIPSIHV
jgi:hypothetical protein